MASIINHGLWTSCSLVAPDEGASPHAPGSDDAVFSRRSDFWVISYQGKSAILKDTRGLQCLARLLREPGVQVHVADLIGRAVAPAAMAGLAPCAEDELPTGLLDGWPLLDARAKAEYRNRIAALRGEMARAEDNNQLDRASEARAELAELAARLTAAVGLGGRDRKAGSDAERARSAVTKRIKESIARIREALPELGDHFATRIKTGYLCSYIPGPGAGPRWKM